MLVGSFGLIVSNLLPKSVTPFTGKENIYLTIQQVQQYQQPNEFPPHPVVQSKMNPNSHMNFGQQPSQHREDEQQTPQIQKDIMYILIPSILLYSSPVQAHILKILPSLFKEERPTILGNIVNGLVISIVFVGLKNMKIKFS